MPIENAHIGDAKILKQTPWLLHERHNGSSQTLGPCGELRADERYAGDGAVVPTLAFAPASGELHLGEIGGDRADRWRDGHLVVVQNDEQRRAAMADVVERFQAQAAHECRITNNDGDLFAAATHVTRQRETLSDGDAGSSVPTVEHVVG